MTRPQGPISVAESIDAVAPQAAVLAGFFGADLRDLRDSRLLNLAARMLTTRMTKTIREERQLVYSIGAPRSRRSSTPVRALRAAVARRIWARRQGWRRRWRTCTPSSPSDGPRRTRLTVAKKQMANLPDEVLKTPEFWQNRLSTLDHHGESLDRPARGRRRPTNASLPRRFARPSARYARREYGSFVVTPASVLTQKFVDARRPGGARALP
jgi:hypothetical protein